MPLIRHLAALAALATLSPLALPADDGGAMGRAAAQTGLEVAGDTGRLGFGVDPAASPGTDFFGASGLGRSRTDILTIPDPDTALGRVTRPAPFPVVKPVPPVRPEMRPTRTDAAR